MSLRLCLLTGVLALCSGSARGADSEAAAARGARLYRTGTTAHGPAPQLRLAGSAQWLPAATLPCQNCHGDQGQGGNEAGVPVPDLRPASLAHPRVDGPRQRPAYTRALLVRAITLGLDSAGQRLHPAMPRYLLSLQAADDLLAWLEVLGVQDEAGISAGTVWLAYRGPLPPPLLPATPLYGRRLRWVDAGVQTPFLTLDATTDGNATLQAAAAAGQAALVLHADGDPGAAGFVLLDSGALAQRRALDRHGAIRQERFVVDPPCIDHGTAARYYTQAAAAACPPPDDDPRPLVVAAAYPPDSAFRRRGAALLLEIVQQALSDLGQRPTRATLVQWLERYRQPARDGFPALRWQAQQHVAARAAWLMTFDPGSNTLQPHPGWVEAPPTGLP